MEETILKPVSVRDSAPLYFVHSKKCGTPELVYIWKPGLLAFDKNKDES